jgi:hypothetical protein
MKWFMPDLYNMVLYFENPGYSSSIPAFKALVPDAWGAREYFDSLGSWASGDKFKPSAQ